MDHLAPSSCLCYLLPQRSETWLLPSDIQVFNCSISVYMYNSIRIINWYSNGKHLASTVNLHTVPFAFSRTGIPHKVIQISIFSPPSSRKSFHTFIVQRFFGHNLHFIMEPLSLQNHYFFNLYTLSFTLYCKVYGFWQMLSVITPPLQYHL